MTDAKAIDLTSDAYFMGEALRFARMVYEATCQAAR